MGLGLASCGKSGWLKTTSTARRKKHREGGKISPLLSSPAMTGTYLFTRKNSTDKRSSTPRRTTNTNATAGPPLLLLPAGGHGLRLAPTARSSVAPPVRVTTTTKIIGRGKREKIASEVRQNTQHIYNTSPTKLFAERGYTHVS